MEVSGDEAEGLDASDGEGDEHGDEGDGEVVVELADGFDVSPAVGSEHEDVVGGVDEGHAGGEERGEDEDREEREAFGGFGGGEAEQADFGGGVEAEAEEQAERIHVPAAADHAEDGAEESSEEAATAEEDVEVFVDVGLAATNGFEGAEDGAEDDEVRDGDGEEKEGGDEGADETTDFAGAIDVVVQGEGAGGDGDGAEDDDGGVAEGKHEAHGDGALALLHQLAGDVVDGGDVVGVDGMAEAEAVGEEGGAEKDGETVKGDDCPEPRTDVEGQEEDIDGDDLRSGVAGLVGEQRSQYGGH